MEPEKKEMAFSLLDSLLGIWYPKKKSIQEIDTVKYEKSGKEVSVIYGLDSCFCCYVFCLD